MTEAFRTTETAAAARTTPQAVRRRHPVSTITVQREVWVVARRLAAGDVQRIEVLGASAVVVHNSCHRASARRKTQQGKGRGRNDN